MKSFFRIAICFVGSITSSFSVILTPFLTQKGFTQTIEVSKISFENWEIIQETSQYNYHLDFYSEKVNLSNDSQKIPLNIILNSEQLMEAISLNEMIQQSFKSGIPAPNDSNVSQRASDLQFQAQIDSVENQEQIEETQPTLEEPLVPEIKNEPTKPATSGGASLAEKFQNPIANLISVPFQNNTNFGFGELDRTQNVLNIQPVVPIDLSDNWLLVARTIFPVIYQPAVTKNQDSHFGLGDINPQLFFVPKTDSKIYLGSWPCFSLTYGDR